MVNINKGITEKAILNRLKFMEFVDSQPTTLSTHKILEKYRAQGGHIDNKFASPYIASVTSKKTRLDYIIKYPYRQGVKIFDGILSKRKMAQISQDQIKHAYLSEATEIHLTWTRIMVRTTTLKPYAIEEPIHIDEVF